MNIIPDDIDFDAYLKGPDEAAMILPASSWIDEVIEEFERPAQLSGAALPWSSTQKIIRLRRGELTIWPGINGHGKSMLIGQVALNLLAQGEKVCIASMEMKPAKTMKRMSRQAFACEKPDRSDLRDLHTWSDDRLWLYAQMGEVSAERVLAVGRYSHEQFGVNHLVVDNLLSCGIDEEDYSAQKRFVLALATHAHDTGQSVHLLAHSRKYKDEQKPPGKFDVRGASAITDLADNVFIVWRNVGKETSQDEGKHDKDDEPDAQLIVCKHRHGEWEGRIRLWFDRRSQTYLQSSAEQPRAMQLLADEDKVEF